MTGKQQVILGPRDLALVMRLRNGAEAPGGTSKETASEAADRIIELRSQAPALADALRDAEALLREAHTTLSHARRNAQDVADALLPDDDPEEPQRILAQSSDNVTAALSLGIERVRAVLAAIGETGK